MIPIFDLHQDSLTRMAKDKSDFFDNSQGTVNYGSLKEGNVFGSVFAMFSESNNKDEIQAELKLFEIICKSAKIRKIKNAKDVNLFDGKINVSLHLEGADLIGEGAYNLEELYEMGLRSVGLVWMNSNTFAGGLKEPAKGLTKAGELFIKKCNKLGIIIDVSHLNEKSFYDVLKITSKPIIASHSNCYAINPNIRNLKDEQIKLIAENGGVIGISINPIFVKDFKGKWIDAVEKTTSLKEICGHILHIKNLVGIDYVALGSDFDGAPVPEVLQDASQYQKIIGFLKIMGFTDEEIRKVAFENFLRVLESQEFNNFGRMDHIALELSDINEGIKFFHQILGMSIKADFMYKGLRYIIIDAGAIEIELFENKDKIIQDKPFLPLNSRGVNHLGIKVSNIESVKHVLEANKIELIKDIYKIENNMISIIALGPDNIEFQFSEDINSSEK